MAERGAPGADGAELYAQRQGTAGQVQMALVSRPRESRSDVEVATQAQVLAVTTPVWVAGAAAPAPAFLSNDWKRGPR